MEAVNDALSSYVHDHLAGAVVAVNLLQALRDEHAGEPLAPFAARLLEDVEADRETLRELAERIGAPRGSALKEATAWIAEKVGRLKLGRTAAGPLGTFEALEALALGILGKLSLWRALAVVAEVDERLAGVDYEELATRAMAQHEAVEERRLGLARLALRGDAAAAEAGGAPVPSHH
jgi:hypothetical protein